MQVIGRYAAVCLSEHVDYRRGFAHTSTLRVNHIGERAEALIMSASMNAGTIPPLSIDTFCGGLFLSQVATGCARAVLAGLLHHHKRRVAVLRGCWTLHSMLILGVEPCARVVT